MKALVLFKGTGSVDRSLEALGFEVDSLDIDRKCDATWTANIMDWQEWEQIEPGTYDFIWASCPCQQYSRARTTARTPRDLVGSDAVVARTLQIIQRLGPKGWILENPATGLLKSREVVAGIPWRDVCYCRYSDGIRHTYRKPTRLWGVLPTFHPRPMCTRKDPCPFSVSGQHPCCAQRFDGKNRIHHSLNDLYSMPQELTDNLARAALALGGDGVWEVV